MREPSFKHINERDRGETIVSRTGLSTLPREYFEWLLDSRDEIIRIIGSNPSLGIRAFAVAPLNNLPPEVLASANVLINNGRIAEAVDRLIEATISDVKRELIKDLPQSAAADLTVV